MVFGVNPKSNDQMQQFIDQAKIQNGTTTAPTTPAPAQTVTVKVGGQGPKLTFDPPFLPSVAPGTVVRFDFLFKNHTLTESSRYSPCTKSKNSLVDTDFQNVNEADTPGAKPFDLTVDSSSPRYFYCKQANHCGAGMVFALNTQESDFMGFQDLAKATGKTTPTPANGAPAPAAPPASYRRVARVW
jgi:plastocyanin